MMNILHHPQQLLARDAIRLLIYLFESFDVSRLFQVSIPPRDNPILLKLGQCLYSISPNNKLNKMPKLTSLQMKVTFLPT